MSVGKLVIINFGTVQYSLWGGGGGGWGGGGVGGGRTQYYFAKIIIEL